MFKKVFPLSNVNSHRQQTWGYSTKDSRDPSGKSEHETKEVPEIERSYSSPTLIDDEKLEISEISIDPFDIPNTLSRSRSLLFDISGKSNINNLGRRSSKSVRFEEQAFKNIDKSIYPKADGRFKVVEQNINLSKFNKVGDITCGNNSISSESQTSHYDQSVEHSNNTWIITDDCVKTSNLVDFGISNSGYGGLKRDQRLNENCHLINVVPNKKKSLDKNYVSSQLKLPNPKLSQVQLKLSQQDYQVQRETLDSEKLNMHVYHKPVNEVESFERKCAEEYEELDEHTIDTIDSSLKGLVSFETQEYVKEHVTEHLLGQTSQDSGVNSNSDQLNLEDVRILEMNPDKSYKGLNDRINSYNNISNNLKTDNDKHLYDTELFKNSNDLRSDKYNFNNIREENAILIKKLTKSEEQNESLKVLIKQYESKNHNETVKNNSISEKYHGMQTKETLINKGNNSNSKMLDKIIKHFGNKFHLTDEQSLDDAIIKIFDEREDNKNENSKLKDENRNLKEELESLRNGMTDLEAINKNAKQEIYDANNKNAKQEVYDLKSSKDIELFRKEKELDVAKRNSESVLRQLELSNKKANEVGLEIKTLNNEKFVLVNSNLQFEQQVTGLENKLKDLTNQINELNNKVNSKTIDLNFLRKQLDEDKNLSKFELNKRDEIISNLSSTIENKHNEANNLNNLMNILEKELIEKINLINDSTAQLGGLYEENQILVNGKNDLLHEINLITKDRNTLKDKLNELNLIVEKHEEVKLKNFKHINQINKSYKVLINFFTQLHTNIITKLKPMMYEESINYITERLKLLETIKIQNNNDEYFKEINKFVVTAIAAIVENYLDTASVLEQEFHQKQVNYNKMLNDLSQIMRANISKSKTSSIINTKVQSKSLPTRKVRK